MSLFPTGRLAGAVVLSSAVVVAACGTRSVELTDPAELAESSEVAQSDHNATTTIGATSTSVPAATTTASPVAPEPADSTAPSTTSSPAELRLDGEGVPVNGQTSGVMVTADGWVVPVLAPSGAGWQVWTPCGREAQISSGEFIESVDFVIDPGHGGSEPGAVGAGGTREADLNLRLARRIADELEADGYTVLMTRTGDVRVPIATRAEIALALDPIAFLSVHHNAGTEVVSAEPGTEMFFQLASSESKRLAGLIYEETRRFLDPLGATWFALSDAGAMGRANRDGGDYYGVLRRPAGVTSVLAEFGYITNPVEEDLLNRPEVQAGLAEAVRGAVERFVATDDSGSGFTEDPIFRGYEPSGAGRTTNCTDPVLD